MVNGLRKEFLTGRTRDMKFRRHQLERLLDLVTDNYDAIHEALMKDLRKPLLEALGSELGFIQRDIRHTLWHLNSMAKPTKVPKHISNPTDSISVNHDPYGVVCNNLLLTTLSKVQKLKNRS